jgi:hypothetical protein
MTRTGAAPEPEEDLPVESSFPVAHCRHCGTVLLIELPGLRATVDEFFSKVVLHEAGCAERHVSGDDDDLPSLRTT